MLSLNPDSDYSSGLYPVSTVHRDAGWRQTYPRAEMGWARNKTCAGARGWQTHPGKMDNFGAFPSWLLLLPLQPSMS